MIRKFCITVGLTATLIAVPATAAFAHDCFVANRSVQGSLGAAHSGEWFTFTLEEALVGFFNVPPQNIPAAAAAARAAGIPGAFASRTNKVLLDGNAADLKGKTADGKGVEHFDTSPIIAELVGIAIQFGGHP